MNRLIFVKLAKIFNFFLLRKNTLKICNQIRRKKREMEMVNMVASVKLMSV